jgi:DNA-binding MarR family transcriptional regulator
VKSPRIAATETKDEPEPLGEALGFMRLLWAVVHGLEARSKYMLAILGVTGPQRMVLRLVGHFGTSSAGDLARALHIHPSSLTGMLRRLEDGGLLARRSHPEDGRMAVLSLTAKGRRLNAKHRGTVEAAVKRALADIPPSDLWAAERVLQRLAAEFDVDDDES